MYLDRRSSGGSFFLRCIAATLFLLFSLVSEKEEEHDAKMFGSRKSPSQAAAPSAKYSLQGLRQVYSELLTSHAESRAARAASRPPPVGRRESLIETIRTISEIIIYGEQNIEQELIFDYFCEKNMLALLTDMMKAPWSDDAVQCQIIQTVAILVQNVRNETSLYYLLSNNYVGGGSWTVVRRFGSPSPS